MQSLTVSTVQFLYTSSLWFKKSIQKAQVCELPILCPETSTILYSHEFGFRTCTGLDFYT
jgi:hypothetical protein